MKKQTTATTCDSDEMFRADLAHAVNTMGAALRSLQRHPQYRPNGRAEFQMYYEDLVEDLHIFREVEKRARERS